jgi:hypothetical protein
MPRLSLTGGDYQARGLIASAQTCVNLYPEPNPEGSPSPYTYYPTEGLSFFFRPVGASGTVRCLYSASNARRFGIIGNQVWFLNGPGPTPGPNSSFLVGTIGSISGPAAMQDNGIVVVVVDGSANGWYFPINPGPNDVTQISDPAFYGANTIAYLDTFLIFNNPNTNQWYVSPSNYAGNSTPFDGTYLVAKTTDPDTVAAVAVVGQMLWIIGIYNIELWYDSGASDFPFQRLSGVAINCGCMAPSSVVVDDGNIYWLGRSQHGSRQVRLGNGTEATIISTRAVEDAIASYHTVSDAIGMIYQLNGHSYYILTFPTADATWVYDATTQLWHQRASLMPDGLQHRWRPTALMLIDDEIHAGDAMGDGSIYLITPHVLADDNGTAIGALPITRTRDFPHIMADGRRGIFRQFTLDMTTGTNQTVYVSMSADRGNTFSAPIALSTGATPDTYPTLWRLGLSRDVVFRVSWSFAVETALNGAFLTMDAVRS